MLMTDYEYRIEVLENEIKSKQKRLNELKHEEEIFKATLTDICPACKGSRKESYTDAAGSTDIKICSVCNGYGKISNIKCKPELEYRNIPNAQCPCCGRLLEI